MKNTDRYSFMVNQQISSLKFWSRPVLSPLMKVLSSTLMKFFLFSFIVAFSVSFPFCVCVCLCLFYLYACHLTVFYYFTPIENGP